MVDADDLAPSGDDDDEGRPAASGPAAAVIDVHGKLQDMVWAAMQSAGISCLMSPAETDHQLAALHRLGLIWAALTSDSDLLALRVPCVVSYEWRTGECLFVDVPFWRPIDTWAAGETDPLHWLVLAYARGGDELARAALMLYVCIVDSDFNQIPYIGPMRAVELVLGELGTLPAYDAATFDAFLDTWAPSVHALHDRHVLNEQRRRTVEQVWLRAGMMSSRPRARIEVQSVKPRSAMMASPRSNRSKRPLCRTISSSEMLPAYPSETNEMQPHGVMPMRNLRV